MALNGGRGGGAPRRHSRNSPLEDFSEMTFIFARARARPSPSSEKNIVIRSIHFFFSFPRIFFLRLIFCFVFSPLLFENVGQRHRSSSIIIQESYSLKFHLLLLGHVSFLHFLFVAGLLLAGWIFLVTHSAQRRRRRSGEYFPENYPDATVSQSDNNNNNNSNSSHTETTKNLFPYIQI